MVTVTCIHCRTKFETDAWRNRKFCSTVCFGKYKTAHATGGERRNQDSIYEVWKDMRKRCFNTRAHDYVHYGGRGITICSEWADFTVFRTWALANGYSPDLTIDRKNNDGNYEPGNCHFVEWSVQCINRRNNLRLTAFGETKTVVEWSKDPRCIVTKRTLYCRLRVQKITLEKAMTHPVHKFGKKPFNSLRHRQS